MFIHTGAMSQDNTLSSYITALNCLHENTMSLKTNIQKGEQRDVFHLLEVI